MNNDESLTSILSQKKQNVVIVRVSGRDSSDNKGKSRPFSISESGESSFTGSGIIVDYSLGIVITTATLFTPFIDFNKSEETLLSGTNVYILHDKTAEKDKMEEITWISVKLIEIKRPASGLKDAIVGVVGTIDTWKVGWHVKAKEQPMFASLSQYLDKIAILQIQKEELTQIPRSSFEWEDISNLKKGEQVITIGSPFGLISPKLMMNSASIGTVCNYISVASTPRSTASNTPTTASPTTAPPTIPLFITDSKCIAGMEGGAVFNSRGKLVGMMLPPLRRKGSHVEFYFVISSQSLIETLLPIFNSNQFPVISRKESKQNKKLTSLALAEKSVVLVTVEHYWGSGFILSRTGYILTAAHLIRPLMSSRTECKSKIKIRVDTSPQGIQALDLDLTRLDSHDPVWTWFEAKVVFICLEGSHVDAVLLKITNLNFSFLPINYEDKVEYLEGQKVNIFGYPIYVPDDKLRVTITTGIISKVVSIDEKPCLLETTAAVHFGNSGGVLLTMDGRLLGMVTSNARQVGSNKIIPRINFSLSKEELSPFFTFIQEEDMKVLQSLDILSEVKKSLWDLQHRPPLYPSSSKKVPSKLISFIEEMEKNPPKSKL